MSGMSDHNRGTIEEFRENGGKVGGIWQGKPLLLLTTTGAKSGRHYTHPLMYLRENGHLYIFASKGGAPANPDWYHNLRAHPEVTVEVGDQKFRATAKPVAGKERDEIYANWAREYPQFQGYQEKTERTIPVIELEPEKR